MLNFHSVKGIASICKISFETFVDDKEIYNHNNSLNYQMNNNKTTKKKLSTCSKKSSNKKKKNLKWVGKKILN